MTDRASILVPASAERRRIAVAIAALVLGAIAMGASPVFVRFAEVGPYASAFWRAALALPLLWAWMRFEERDGIRGGTDRAAVVAGVLFAGDLFFWHLSIFATTVANATFFATTSPIWVALGAWLILSEAIAPRIIAGLVLCLIGGSALFGQSYGFAPERLPGDIFGVITAMFFGSYMLAVRAARERVRAARLAFVSTAATAACLFVIAIALEPTLWPASLHGAIALVALAAISQVGGQGLLAVALGTLPATFSSLVMFVEALAAAAFGWAIFGEALGPLQAVGGMLILAGIWIARPRGGAL